MRSALVALVCVVLFSTVGHSAPGAPVSPALALAVLDRRIAVLDGEEQNTRSELARLSPSASAAHAKVLERNREYYKLTRAGMLPVGAGFEALRARLHAGESLATLVAASGTRLITSGLQPWSRWVTPVGLPKRFDTLFFVARTPVGQVPEVDAGETTTLAWVNPPTALEMREKGEFPMEFATVSTVESLRPFATAQALLDHAAAQTRLPAIHPRMKVDAEGRMRGVLLPGQAGYDQAHGADLSPAAGAAG